MAHDIGSLIREMRKAAGMSQMRLADKIGVSYQMIQKYEKGTSKLSVPRLMQFADVFGVPVTAFLDTSKSGKTKKKSELSNLTEDEGQLLMFFRRLKRKRLKASFLDMIKDIVKLAEKT